MEINLSKFELVDLLIEIQGLNKYIDFNKNNLEKTMQQLGCIQYDPLSIVGKNQDIIMQARFNNYYINDLNYYLYDNRILIDGWDKEMSIFQINDWPYFKRVRQSRECDVKNILKYRGQTEALNYIDEIINIINNKLVISSNEIDFGKSNTSRWGTKRLSGAALDYLFNSGIIGINRRIGTKRIYSPINEIIPENIINYEDPFETENDFLEWYFLRRIKSLGVCWDKSGGGWNGSYLHNKQLRVEVINRLLDKNLVIKLNVPEFKESFYVSTNNFKSYTKNIQFDENIRFLAPLDNLLWDRKFIKKLFGFDYSWEVYTPKTKRKYGYYVLPVLYKNRFIARMEPEKSNDFKIKDWWWESNVNISDKELREAVEKSIIRFSAYLQKQQNIDYNMKKIFSI